MDSPPAQHAKVTRRGVSLRRKLLVTGLAVGAAALQIYLADIPRTLNLPQDEVDAHTSAKADNERIEIDQPALPEGGVLLSYAGRAGEVVDVHFEKAIVDSSNAVLQSSLKAVKAVPARVAYVSLPASSASHVAASFPAAGDTCHTFVEVRRAKDSSPITTISAFLLNGSANNEQRREMRVWTEGGTLDVEIHTDPPPGRETQFNVLPGCSKMLQVRPLDNNDSSGAVDAHLIQAPVRLTVPELKRQKASSPVNAFRIGVTPAFPTPLKWMSADDLFAGISLGDNSLECRQLRVLPLNADRGEYLKARAEGNSNLVVDRLGFSLNALKLRISGRSWVEIDGQPLGFNFIQFLKENPILSGVLALVNASILLLVKQTFFARADAEADEGS